VDRHNDIAEAMSLAGDREGSVESYRKSLAREPTAAAYHGLAQGLTWIGGLEEAEINFRRALELNPQAWWTHSALLVLLNHIPGRSAAEIYAEHVKFGRRYDPRLGKRQWQNKRDSARRLRVGYVSGELREHSVVYFFEPLLAKHNRREFEVTCYHSSPWSDDTTERMKSLADRWRDVDRLDDDALANQIRDDRIDILVDLSGHSGHARLPAFARKPAPVQVTWLGYLNTTGLEQMDWRVTDRYAAPDGMLDRYHTEKLLRLEHGQWCYLPPQSAPAVAQSPFLKAGHCTFGAFATPSKMNPVVIALWRRLLDLVPGTRLRVVTNAVNKIPAAFRQKVLDGGIDPRRLDLLPRCSFDEYLALHESVDVMLDTFPYTGGTTTCHCLWMGVPLVTLTGDTSTSRGGASLLHAVGLEEFVARSPEKYVQIAANLARDPERLVSLRSTLRERMSGSRLMDAAGFTQEFEQAYRFMWQEWCKRAD
jgi:predicted O-linked N-acetylglucosamine transferase (SPINDLY family)